MVANLMLVGPQIAPIQTAQAANNWSNVNPTNGFGPSSTNSTDPIIFKDHLYLAGLSASGATQLWRLNKANQSWILVVDNGFNHDGSPSTGAIQDLIAVSFAGTDYLYAAVNHSCAANANGQPTPANLCQFVWRTTDGINWAPAAPNNFYQPSSWASSGPLQNLNPTLKFTIRNTTLYLAVSREVAPVNRARVFYTSDGNNWQLKSPFTSDPNSGASTPGYNQGRAVKRVTSGSKDYVFTLATKSNAASNVALSIYRNESGNNWTSGWTSSDDLATDASYGYVDDLINYRGALLGMLSITDTNNNWQSNRLFSQAINDKWFKQFDDLKSITNTANMRFTSWTVFADFLYVSFSDGTNSQIWRYNGIGSISDKNNWQQIGSLYGNGKVTGFVEFNNFLYLTTNGSGGIGLYRWEGSYPNCGKPSDILFLLDRSNSMSSQSLTPGLNRLQATKNTLNTFLDDLKTVDANERVGLMTFWGNPPQTKVDQDLSANYDLVKQAINSLTSDASNSSGLYAALEQARNYLKNNLRQSGSLPTLVLITDGVPTVVKNDGEFTEAQVSAVKMVKNDGTFYDRNYIAGQGVLVSGHHAGEALANVMDEVNALHSVNGLPQTKTFAIGLNSSPSFNTDILNFVAAADSIQSTIGKARTKIVNNGNDLNQAISDIYNSFGCSSRGWLDITLPTRYLLTPTWLTVGQTDQTGFSETDSSEWLKFVLFPYIGSGCSSNFQAEEDYNYQYNGPNPAGPDQSPFRFEIKVERPLGENPLCQATYNDPGYLDYFKIKVLGLPPTLPAKEWVVRVSPPAGSFTLLPIVASITANLTSHGNTESTYFSNTDNCSSQANGSGSWICFKSVIKFSSPTTPDQIQTTIEKIGGVKGLEVKGNVAASGQISGFTLNSQALAVGGAISINGGNQLPNYYDSSIFKWQAAQTSIDAAYGKKTVGKQIDSQSEIGYLGGLLSFSNWNLNSATKSPDGTTSSFSTPPDGQLWSINNAENRYVLNRPMTFKGKGTLVFDNDVQFNEPISCEAGTLLAVIAKGDITFKNLNVDCGLYIALKDGGGSGNILLNSLSSNQVDEAGFRGNLIAQNDVRLPSISNLASSLTITPDTDIYAQPTVLVKELLGLILSTSS